MSFAYRRFSASLVIITLAGIVFLTACTGPQKSPKSPSIPGLPATLAAQTLTAQQGGGASPFLATPTPKPQTEQPAPAAILPQGPIPTSPGEPQETPDDKNLQAGQNLVHCDNAAQFIKDITIPDDTKVKAQQRFTKTWQFQNVGTCIWTPEYRLVFVWGDKMGGIDQMPIGQTVAPGQLVNISIALVAPKDNNFYQGNWLFMDNLGNTFGTGYKARDFFWVAINVTGGSGGGGGFCGGGG